jgi:nicotinamidase/pyrazinamidase
MKALILVDLQNDFMPGGALPVPHGDAVIPLANRLQGRFKLVVATQDWHPPNHRGFATQHPDKKPGDVILLRRGPLILRPVHGVQHTRGAEFAPGLMLSRVNKILHKGTDPEIDSYSAFFDQGHEQATGLHEYLNDKRVTDVFVLGVATDYGVKFTALDAVALGFKTHLVEDACRGVNLQPGDVAGALEELRKAGVKLVQSRDLLASGWS